MDKKVEKLVYLLEEDLGWRRKEISNLLLLSNQYNEEIIVKSLILLLYSHWEGYIKNISKQYLSFVSKKKLSLNSLSTNFEAIHLKGLFGELKNSSDTLTLNNELKLLNSIYGLEHKIFKLDKSFNNEKDKTIVNTKDNLDLTVLNSILKVIGIEEKPCLLSKEKLINEYLLKNRNIIAHGSKVDTSENEFSLKIEEAKKIRDLIFSIMNCIKDDIIYFAENELYLYKNHKLCVTYTTNSNTSLESTIQHIIIGED